MHLADFTFEELFIGRHGLSLANLAIVLAKNGDESMVNTIRHLHTSEIDLAPAGFEQSARKGHWLKTKKHVPFDFHYVSRYRRAVQTAAHMELPGSWWIQDARLNERDWGPMDQITPRERNARWPGWEDGYWEDPFEWRVDGMQSLREKTLQVWNFLTEKSTEHTGERGCIVAHGETNMALMATIEHFTREQFNEAFRTVFMGNATLVHYRTESDGVIRRQFIDPHSGSVSEWRTVR